MEIKIFEEMLPILNKYKLTERAFQSLEIGET